MLLPNNVHIFNQKHTSVKGRYGLWGCLISCLIVLPLRTIQAAGSALMKHRTHYGKGDGIEQDYSKCVEWLEKAIENGNEKACYLLGVMNCLYEKVEGED